jgi:single-strand DNA-binding protein
MNSCILMAEIIQDPQLRYTSDTQTPIAEMLVQFAGLRPDDPPATLKVVGWGNLAQEIQERYHQGDGSSSSVAAPAAAAVTPARTAPAAAARTPAAAPANRTAPPMSAPEAAPRTATKSKPPAPPAVEPDYDDIPF